jgi:hypothetical protein
MAAAATAAQLQQQAAALAQQQQEIQALQAALQQVLGAAAPGGAAARVGAAPAFDAVHNAALLALARRQAAIPPPQFKGTATGLEAQRWLQGIDLYFEEADISADRERLIAAGRVLVGPAATWWESERVRTPNDPAKITTWAQFVAALRKRYEPVDKSVWGRQQLAALTSKGMVNVTSYTEQFMELSALLSDMAEADRIFYYTQGLPAHLRSILSTKASALSSLQEAVETATRAEASRSNLSAPAGGGQPRWQQRSGQRPAALNQMEDGDTEGPSMSALGNSIRLLQEQLSVMQQKGGRGREQPRKKLGYTEGLSAELARARIAKGLCIHCGQSGHMKNDCKNAADITSQPK